MQLKERKDCNTINESLEETYLVIVSLFFLIVDKSTRFYLLEKYTDKFKKLLSKEFISRDRLLEIIYFVEIIYYEQDNLHEFVGDEINIHYCLDGFLWFLKSYAIERKKKRC